VADPGIPQVPVETLIARELHNLLYLEEFAFAANRFSPPDGSEVELADAVVSLDDTLLIFQIKERSMTSARNAESERAWFNNKVLKEAKNQVRDTARFLSSLNDIPIANERGRVFNLAASHYREVIKIIVYQASEALPLDCQDIRFYRSREAGYIHILSYADYVRLSSVLRVPEEIIRYFQYRENVMTQFEATGSKLPEASLVGGFIGDMGEPTYEAYLNLHRIVDDEESWDLIPLLRGLHDHQTPEGFNEDYYRILTEFMRLPRSMWREIKKRFVLSVENVSNDKFVLPYRVSFPDRDIGFVFLPMTSECSSAADWDTFKITALTNMTALHKFDHKLGKAIGILVGKIGPIFDIQWCMIVDPWTDDPELRARLDEDSPFRPATERVSYGFFLQS
jgi:hypothetical protein